MDHDQVKVAVKEAFREEMKDFYIERERHYLDHEFISELRKFADACKGTFINTVIKAVVGGILVLIVAGFIAWKTK